MAETKEKRVADAESNGRMDTIEAYGKGRSWESAFRNLNQCDPHPAAIELIYLMCELESSVVFVEHAERVFNEASQDFKELKLRISDQLLFQSYIEESPVEEIDHLSIAWDVPSFKLDYSRHLPDEGAAPGCAELLQNDRFAPHSNSPLPPFPSGSICEDDTLSTDDVRAASTGALVDEKAPLSPAQSSTQTRSTQAPANTTTSTAETFQYSYELLIRSTLAQPKKVLWSEACVVTPQRMTRPRATSENACIDTFSPDAQPGPRLAASQLRPRLVSSPHSSAGPHASPGTGGGDSGGGARVSGQRGASVVRTPGGRSLHHKLLSPERFKRDPAETRRVADEKQQRAERLRSELDAERKAKLEKAKQEREAVRSLQGELQQVRQQEQRARHALSQERRKVLLHGIVARATDESEKVKEVQFIKQLEADSSRAALEARLERGGVRRREKLARRQLRNGREVDYVLEDAQRRKQAREQARMEELFAKLEKKEEAIAKLEVERKKGRTTPATDADSTASSVLMDSPAADSSAASVSETPKQRRERLEVERAHERHAALERRLQEAAERRAQMLYASRTAATLAKGSVPPVATLSPPPQGGHGDAATGDGEEGNAAEPQPGAATAAGAPACKAHVQRETWAGRVLRSRGVKGDEHAKSSAVYSHILKSLRTKASKLRKRLAVEACAHAEGPSSSSCEHASSSCEIDSDGVPSSAATEGTAEGISAAVQSQSAEGLMHALAAVGHVPTCAPPPAHPRSYDPQEAAGRPTHHHSDLLQSSGLLRTVAEALVATAATSPTSTAPASRDAASHTWPVESLVATATTLVSLTPFPATRVAALGFPCFVGLVDATRIHLDAAIEQINPSPTAIGADKGTLPATDSSEPSAGIPQHAAVISCMAVLIQVLQCHPVSQEMRCRRCDVIAYALAAGLVYRIAHFFLLMHGTVGVAAAVPASVRHSMQLLELLTAADPRAVLSTARHFRGSADSLVCLRVKSIRANLVTMARDTSLMGLSALLSASLLPAATASSRGPTAELAHPPDGPHPPVPRLAATDLLPGDLLPSALSALRTINGLLLLALEDVQSLLAAPDLSAELLFVLALVLSLCSARWPGDDGVVALLLHEAVLLLGLYANGNSGHQHKLCWGPAPSLLQRLCAVPAQYLHTTEPCKSGCIHAQDHASSSQCHSQFAAMVVKGCDAVHAAAHRPHAACSDIAATCPSDTSMEYVESGSPGLSPVAIRSPRGSSGATHSPASEEKRSMSLSSIACPQNGVSEGAGAAPQPVAYVCGPAAAPSAPAYLQHVLYPSLLAACLDAPRNCQAVIDALGAQGILDYCTAHPPPNPATSSSASLRAHGVAHPPTCSRTASVSPRTPAAAAATAAAAPQLHDDGSSFMCAARRCPPPAVAGAGDNVSAFAIDRIRLSEGEPQEWQVDLGPLDGRFHPQHRIPAGSWWRAHDQLLAASAGAIMSRSGASTQDAAPCSPPP